MDDQDDLPARLTAGPLTVRVDRTPSGPMMAADEPAAEPLSFAVNASFGGVLDGLAERVAAGESMARSGLFVMHVSTVTGEPPGADNWRALTGTDPGQDAYVIGAEFLKETVQVPRDVLVDLLAEFARLRAIGTSAP